MSTSICRCPICHKKTKPDEFMHTSDIIRQLGIQMEWKDLSVCFACFGVVDTLYVIIKADKGVTTRSLS